ncbi:MAG: PLP-dependent aminotransferase family protein, partial [Pseudomonadota bacterium]
MSTIWVPELVNGSGPKYKAVADAIRQGIAAGDLTPGTKLPPVRDLAWRLGITPGTVARAYTLLTDDGTATAGVGRGTFVAAPDAGAPLLREVPLEVDSATHNAEVQTWHVNLFSPHLPSVGQAPLMRRLLGEIAQDPPSGLMHYPTRVGARAARDAVVQWLSEAPLGRVDQSQIQLASGGQNAILLVLMSVLNGRRPCVLVEELSYPGFRRAAELLRADVVPVAMDADGIVPEALEAAIRAHDAQVLCTSPEIHNPTLGFTPEPRRQALAQIATQGGLQIIEDDCYRLGAAQAPSYRQIVPERTWYISSISKMLTPALRLGFVVAPEAQIARLRRMAEYAFFGLPTPMTDLCAALLGHPELPAIQAAVRAGVNAYAQRAANVLGSHALSWRQDVPFLLLELPTGWRASAFVRAAEEQGVRVRAAEEYACRDARAPHAVRFAVNAGVPLPAFEAAMERLRALLDNPPE